MPSSSISFNASSKLVINSSLFSKNSNISYSSNTVKSINIPTILLIIYELVIYFSVAIVTTYGYKAVPNIYFFLLPSNLLNEFKLAFKY